MPDQTTDGPDPKEAVDEALIALQRWARRLTMWTLKLTTLEEVMRQTRSDIELHYGGDMAALHGHTPGEVAENLANARREQAVLLERAVDAATRCISGKGSLPGGEEEDIKQEAIVYLLHRFRGGDVAQSPEAVGVAVATWRWNDALRKLHRKRQRISLSYVEADGEDDSPGGLDTVADPESEEIFLRADEELDRPADEERRRVGARQAAALLTGLGAVRLNPTSPRVAPNTVIADGIATATLSTET